jgi:hypothetical protein
MPKTAIFTTYTPLPSGITRKSVMDMYRDHLAMIDLNPLVVERFNCRTPSYAPTEEYYATWYTIKGTRSILVYGFHKVLTVFKTKYHISQVVSQQALFPITPSSTTCQMAWRHMSMHRSASTSVESGAWADHRPRNQGDRVKLVLEFQRLDCTSKRKSE